MAFADVEQMDALLFKAMARIAERREDAFNVQGLAKTAWAFARSSPTWLDFEKRWGDAESPELVRSKAREFVEAQAS